MSKVGVLVVSHGSRSREWVRLVDEAVVAVRLPAEVPVVSAFLEIVEGRLIQDGIDALEQRGVTDILAVPLFVSSGSTHIDEISYALGAKPAPELETELRPFRRRARLHMGAPIDDDEEIAQVLVDKLAGLSEQPEREVVLLIGHGSKEPGFCERWRQGLAGLAERVGRLGGFAAADYALLLPDEAAAKMEQWKRKRPDCAVVVSPVFLSEGYFTNRVIPERLAGYKYLYQAKALLPHPQLTRWLERRIAGLQCKVVGGG